MKKLLAIILVACGTIPVVFGQTTSFDVDGIKVIFKPTVKQIINVRLFYKGGVADYPIGQAGIERFALTAAIECGTEKYAANAFRDQADKYGIITHLAATYDYGDLEMECISKYFDQGWDLFTQAVMNPVFENNEVELLRSKIFSSIKSKESNPDSKAEQMIINEAFEGTPYATDPDGEEQTIKQLTVNDLKAYYAGLLNKKRIFIVVSGKITQDELAAKIKASFGALPSKDYQPVSYNEPQWNDYKLIVEPRGLSTNYINGIMNSPLVNSPEYVPYRVGLSAFGGALFSTLRTQLNLSYDPGASAVPMLMPYGLMYVSTTKPKEAVKAITAQLTRVLANGLSPDGLKNLKGEFITSFYMRQESTSSITQTLGQAEILGGWLNAEQLPALINKVTADEVKDAMNKYIVGLRWSYLGNPDLADAAAGAFKEGIK